MWSRGDSCLQWESMDPQHVFGFYRFTPLCRTYGLLRCFFKLVYGMGQGGDLSFMHGALCPLGRFRL